MSVAPRLTQDDVADIARMLPVEGVTETARYIGCHHSTVFLYAKKLGIADYPRSSGGRKPAQRVRDVPGKAKVCTRCDQLVPLENFNRHTVARDGLHSHCRDCRRKSRWGHAHEARP